MSRTVIGDFSKLLAKAEEDVKKYPIKETIITDKAKAYQLSILNLPNGVTQDELIKFFSFDGIIPTDAFLYKDRNYGIVRYDTDSLVVTALKHYTFIKWRGNELKVVMSAVLVYVKYIYNI